MPSGQQPLDSQSLTAAYAACERLARAHYENFPVASRLLPRRMRPHVAAVYAFARSADDFADEDQRSVTERQRLLDDWLLRLRAAAAVGQPAESEVRPSTGSMRGERVEPGSPESALRKAHSAVRAPNHGVEDLLFFALGNTLRECRLPVSLFEDLLSAFRQDTETVRYQTYEELLDYCRRSANPVGRLVLRIAGHQDERMDAASDCVCTALQLANFWQDLERDWERGRLYVPLSDMRAAGACEQDLDRKLMTSAWRTAVSALVQRTKDLFMRGRDIADLAGGRLGFELRLTWLGGWRILERVEAQDYDVFGRRPALGRGDVLPLLWRAATWRAARVASRRSTMPTARPSAS